MPCGHGCGSCVASIASRSANPAPRRRGSELQLCLRHTRSAHRATHIPDLSSRTSPSPLAALRYSHRVTARVLGVSAADRRAEQSEEGSVTREETRQSDRSGKIELEQPPSLARSEWLMRLQTRSFSSALAPSARLPPSLSSSSDLLGCSISGLLRSLLSSRS